MGFFWFLWKNTVLLWCLLLLAAFCGCFLSGALVQQGAEPAFFYFHLWLPVLWQLEKPISNSGDPSSTFCIHIYVFIFLVILRSCLQNPASPPSQYICFKFFAGISFVLFIWLIIWINVNMENDLFHLIFILLFK